MRNSLNDPKTVVVTTRLPLAEAERLAKVAQDADRTVAAEVRRAVRQHLEPQGASAEAA